LNNFSNNNQQINTANITKSKELKRGSFTGQSILNFSEFVKIYIFISKVNDELKENSKPQKNCNINQNQENGKPDNDHNNDKNLEKKYENGNKFDVMEIKNNLIIEKNKDQNIVKNELIKYEDNSLEIKKKNNQNQENLKPDKKKEKSHKVKFHPILNSENIEEVIFNKNYKETVKSKFLNY